MTAEQNKQMVLEFFETLFNQHRVDEAVDTYLSPSYIQHNPAVPTGAEAMRATTKGLLEQFPDLHVEVKRAFAEGDTVIVHSEMTGVSWGPSSTPAGEGYPSYAVMDIARVEDGRIAEHWDVIQEVPPTSVSGNSMF